MEYFDRSMAIEMIEDALQAISDPIGRGIAIGLCSAFYLSGMIETADWENYEQRILASSPVLDLGDCDVPRYAGYTVTPAASPATKTPTD